MEGWCSNFWSAAKKLSDRSSVQKEQAGAREIVASKIQEQRFALISELAFESVSTKTAHASFDSIIKASPFFEAYSKDRKLQKAGSGGRRTITVVLDKQDDATKNLCVTFPGFRRCMLIGYRQ